ncbi:MAG: glycogen debranching protein GlgX [Thermoguttaceae bacterium]
MTDRPSELRFTYPLPYGPIVHDGGVQFAVFSRSATAMRVLLYDRADDPEPAEQISFNPELNRWGDIWSVFVPGVRPGQLYHFQADGPFDPSKGQRFDGRARLIDPYAKALHGVFLPGDDGIVRPPKCVVAGDEFDWQGDRHLRRRLDETVIYELHVRGFTCAKSSDVSHPGTYLGLIEKIPYLQSLGVTAVELMPVFEFPTNDCLGHAFDRPNYWGYDPLAFFAPHRGYASDGSPGGQVREFKEMVLALHRAGIEVILDVVFNHTAEGNETGPTLSFKGLENRVYYMLENGGGTYRNYSGCGNTLNGNHPIVREMIFHCLRHWVHNYHVDGFRFDLASILSRNRNGELVPNPPLVESIAEDPLLADTKIIAEAWDAAGGYQVGRFGDLRWAEWNGHYRDDLRRFWRGDPNMIGLLATRLAGSSDLYQASGRKPFHSINFITAHDGFTLNDLVSYSEKHNEQNGEDNHDGERNNYSYNYGVEGPTRRAAVESVRLRQIKNFLASLLLSQGVPMVLAGDECRRTQLGNNNAYCQDNDLTWFNWKLVERHAGLRRFCAALIAFRRSEPTVRQAEFLRGQPWREGGLPDVAWFGPAGGQVEWSGETRSLICLLAAAPRRNELSPPNHHVMMLLHAGADARHFIVPTIAREFDWRLLVNTAADSPDDIFPALDGPPRPANDVVTLESRSIQVFVARDEPKP